MSTHCSSKQQKNSTQTVSSFPLYFFSFSCPEATRGQCNLAEQNQQPCGTREVVKFVTRRNVQHRAKNTWLQKNPLQVISFLFAWKNCTYQAPRRKKIHKIIYLWRGVNCPHTELHSWTRGTIPPSNDSIRHDGRRTREHRGPTLNKINENRRNKNNKQEDSRVASWTVDTKSAWQVSKKPTTHSTLRRWWFFFFRSLFDTPVYVICWIPGHWPWGTQNEPCSSTHGTICFWKKVCQKQRSDLEVNDGDYRFWINRALRVFFFFLQPHTFLSVEWSRRKKENKSECIRSI